MNPTDLQILDARATELARGWSVDKDIVVAAMFDSGGAIPGGKDAQIRAWDQPLWHRKNHDSAATELTFFDEAASTYVTNFGNGRFEAQTVFGLENIGIELHIGYNRLGAAGAAVAPAFTSVNADTIVRSVAEEAKRKAFETGLFELKRANEVIGTWHLHDLPSGGGLDAVSMGAITAVGPWSCYSVNGAPFAGNKRPTGRGRVLLAGGDQVSAKIIMPAAANLGTNVNGFWRVSLQGRTYRRK